MREIEFNQFMRLRNHLVISAENFAREAKLSLVLIPTKSKDFDEQLKLGHKVVDVMDRANSEICLILLRYSVGTPVSSFVQVQFF